MPEIKIIAMRIFIISILLILFFPETKTQSVISGTVRDKKDNPLTGANIYFDNTYEGCTSGKEGNFIINTDLKDNQKLIVSYIGFKDFEQELNLNNSTIVLNIILSESSNSINSAVINAGFFEASDKKKSVLLKPLDIVTTASSEGDIYGAVNTLPGTQTVGETGRLFVRGGASYETKTFMDGMLIQTPYTSKLPDIPVRGRFSPFLFNGMLFSTGGYSAEYGQALSSALVLNTNALAEEDVTGISLLSVGCGASHTKRWENTSITGSLDYSNLTPYFKILKHKLNWEKEPESINGTIVFRQKVREEGIIRVFSSVRHSNSSLYYNDYSSNSNNLIQLLNNNFYLNTTYNDMLNDKWMIKGGVAYNFDGENTDINSDYIKDKISAFQARLTLINYLNENISFKFGGEISGIGYNQIFNMVQDSISYDLNFTNNISSFYVESDLKGGSKVAARLGGRFEHSSLLKEHTMVPRLSIAYKTTKKSQVSVAYGIFYQMPQDDYLKFNNELLSERADHYILNYQYQHDKRTFRIEAYYKDYKKLVKYDYLYSPENDSYNNGGYGKARGIDIFWRDKTTLKHSDYWISYSYIDTKRNYENFKELATPTFVSNHNLSVVFKYWISRLSDQLSLTYKYASGRPYYNPNHNNFLSDKTKPYQNLSINSSYLTQLFGNFTIIHFSVNNILGFNNVFGYAYSSEPGTENVFEAHPIEPYAKRTFVLAMFISIK